MRQGVVAHLDLDVPVTGLERDRLVLPDLDRLTPLFGLCGADLQLLVVEDLDRLIPVVFLVEADFQRVVVLDNPLEILLGVDVDFLLALLILKPNLIEVGRFPLLANCGS